MSKFCWRNGFAVGLVVGICLTLLPILTAQFAGHHVDQYGQQVSNAEIKPNADQKKHAEHQNALEYWARRLILLEDTPAQWLMMLFTIAATVFLWRTLTATREVGKDQSRAYLHADRAQFFWSGEAHRLPRVEIWVRNTGQTPAKWYEIRLTTLIYSHEADTKYPRTISEVALPETFSGKWNAIPSDSVGTKCTFIFKEEKEDIETAMESLLHTPTHGFSVVGEIRYCTFFGEIFLSQFCFGRPSLPEYRIKEVRSYMEGDINVTSNIEEPIPLSRYAFDLRTYEKVGDER